MMQLVFLSQRSFSISVNHQLVSQIYTSINTKATRLATSYTEIRRGVTSVTYEQSIQLYVYIFLTSFSLTNVDFISSMYILTI